MNADLLNKIARAVLYEGYILYPYRQSSLKNRCRWNFGVLYPPTWTAAHTGSDHSYFQMEVLAIGALDSRFDATIRFLHLLSRADGNEIWQEALKREAPIEDISIAEILKNPRIQTFSFPANARTEEGILRKQESIEGQAELSATAFGDGVFRVGMLVQNTTAADSQNRDDALLRSLASAHAVLSIRSGEFVSQTNPPDSLRDAAARCRNMGVWPVLVGEDGARDTVLGSPIILPDYPQVAPESTSELFDSTEIDEILTLRILTLSDAEKEEMRRSDARARRILENAEKNPAEHLMQLHGAIRGMRRVQEADAWSAWDTLTKDPQPPNVFISGVELRKGDRVRLRPNKRADIFDTVLEGRTAVVEAIERDLEGNLHFAVILDDDPGRDLGELRQIGHRFFFSTAEVEPIRSLDDREEASR